MIRATIRGNLVGAFNSEEPDWDMLLYIKEKDNDDIVLVLITGKDFSFEKTKKVISYVRNREEIIVEGDLILKHNDLRLPDVYIRAEGKGYVLLFANREGGIK